ncbi:MAG: hypothetical protein MPK11_00395, partial [Gammaproteobacteria bacterium]|nr:hypothetical protein [Gammaproteobacteria bacterium]
MSRAAPPRGKPSKNNKTRRVFSRKRLDTAGARCGILSVKRRAKARCKQISNSIGVFGEVVMFQNMFQSKSGGAGKAL